jgi:predicted outer membrane repeat protein
MSFRTTAATWAIGLVLLLGASSIPAAHAVEGDECRVTFSAAESPTHSAVQTALDSADSGDVCFSGVLELTETLFINRSVTIRGLGEESGFAREEGSGDFDFFSVGPPDHDSNLTVPFFAVEGLVFNGNGAMGKAIDGLVGEDDPLSVIQDIRVTDSTFVRFNGGSAGGAILGAGVTVDSSSFYLNGPATFGGGAILALEVVVANSTFVGNQAQSGGALYVTADLSVTNSTFVGNSTTQNGGAIYATAGSVEFSTFLNNTAVTNSFGVLPGNSIFKNGDEQFIVRGNIFAGSPEQPQLAFLQETTAVRIVDSGGNVFSSALDGEPDLEESVSVLFAPSVYEKSVASLFGDNEDADNGGTTPTVALIATSPAIGAVGPVDSELFDQRGVIRSNPIDAGAYEFVPASSSPGSPVVTVPAEVVPELAKTGSSPLGPFVIGSVLLFAVGMGAVVIRRGISRRI